MQIRCSQRLCYTSLKKKNETSRDFKANKRRFKKSLK